MENIIITIVICITIIFVIGIICFTIYKEDELQGKNHFVGRFDDEE